jgi:hypothetical protein
MFGKRVLDIRRSAPGRRPSRPSVGGVSVEEDKANCEYRNDECIGRDCSYCPRARARDIDNNIYNNNIII